MKLDRRFKNSGTVVVVNPDHNLAEYGKLKQRRIYSYFAIFIFIIIAFLVINIETQVSIVNSSSSYDERQFQTDTDTASKSVTGVTLTSKNTFKPTTQQLQKKQATILLDRSIQTTKSVYTPVLNNLSKVIVKNKQCLSAIPQDHFHKPHLVTPPAGMVTLVCCQTTKGIMNIAVHMNWAPQGAKRFLEMVNSNDFFQSKVPLFRALKGFLVQFGLAGKPVLQKQFNEKGWLVDDPSWLPFGPSHRQRRGLDGSIIKRYQKGYFGYAGAGKDSRGTQLILAFEDNEGLGGGSPWEVPWGQLIGEESYKTLGRVYTGYGETPSQGKIMNRGVEYTEAEFPLMDYITTCGVVKEDLYWKHHSTSTIAQDSKIISSSTLRQKMKQQQLPS